MDLCGWQTSIAGAPPHGSSERRVGLRCRRSTVSKQTEPTSMTTSPRSCRENRQPGGARRRRKKESGDESPHSKVSEARVTWPRLSSQSSQGQRLARISHCSPQVRQHGLLGRSTSPDGLGRPNSANTHCPEIPRTYPISPAEGLCLPSFSSIFMQPRSVVRQRRPRFSLLVWQDCSCTAE